MPRTAGRWGPNGNGSGNGGRPERQYKIVTQYSMGPIEEIGLLKMDFLGLRNLDVIEDAIEIIRRSRSDEIDIEAIPMDDETDLRDARSAGTRSGSSSSSPRGCATRCAR